MADAPSRCEVRPLPEHQVAFLVDGEERVRWHFGTTHPRPFFFPLLGPSRSPLTRMGHPGAPNHDHHLSIWFAHQKVLGIDFWSDQSTARIRQKQWLAYRDAEDEAAAAVLLGWYDGHDPSELLEQELVMAVRPGEHGETLLELQSTFRPKADVFEFGQTNFGFLAVRVAKSLSAHFGGGRLVNSEGAEGEPAIFGQPASWMDYSGPIAVFDKGGRSRVEEGITYFDHPTNPRYPSRWHVRSDGWMSASVCMSESLVVRRETPFVLRYLLHAHGGPLDRARAAAMATSFASTGKYLVQRANVPHEDRRLERESSSA